MSSHRRCGLEQSRPTHGSPVGDHAPTTGDDMIQAPAPPFLERSRRGFAAHGAGPSLPAAWSSRGVHEVEIVVNDMDSTRTSCEYAAPLFSAEVVSGSAWTVRLQRPGEGGWIQELQSLIERWLKSAPASLCQGALWRAQLSGPHLARHLQARPGHRHYGHAHAGKRAGA